MTILYGIPHCSTVKKSRAWLDQHSIPYTFHDFRKQGLSEKKLHTWFQQCDWTTLLNKRSTTWKNLNEEQKASLTEQTAFQLMLENPTMIKRPVLEHLQHTGTGFKEADWQQLFKV